MLFRRSHADAAYQSMVLYAHMADSEIVQKVRSGKKECFEVLMRRHTQALYRVGRMFDFDPRDIEDLIADTHMQAFRSLSKFSSNSTYRTWLTRIMIEKCSRKLEQTFSIGHPASSELFGNSRCAAKAPGVDMVETETAALASDLDGLPMPLRSLFVLREVEGFSEKETASLLNVSEDCVKQGTNRAKLSVKKSLRRNFLGDAVYPFGTNGCERVVSSVMARI
jgi:RNA polymerase sigma factor (sigma-70 family)